MKARRILWLYCVFACLALVAGLIAVIATSGPLRKDTARYSAWVKKAGADADAQRERVQAAEEDQRQRRAELSPADAIRLSVEVQTKQATLKTLEALEQSAQLEYSRVLGDYRNHMARLIPIIALLILHIVGMMLFWPRKI